MKVSAFCYLIEHVYCMKVNKMGVNQFIIIFWITNVSNSEKIYSKAVKYLHLKIKMPFKY